MRTFKFTQNNLCPPVIVELLLAFLAFLGVKESAGDISSVVVVADDS